MQIRIQNLSKVFGSHRVLEQIFLEIDAGEFLSLLGPSGCGKTTLLRLIAGLEQPSSGDILFDNQSILQMPPEKREIGFVFQNYALFPHMTVFQNISYGLRFIYKKINHQTRVSQLLELVQLRGLEKRMPSELSAGQQQRVALARALAPKPKLLLLDEPLSAIDAELRLQLRFEIRRVQRALDMTMLYVTHDQEEALAISDRIAIMNHGQIEQVGNPHHIYQQPKTVFVARFVGKNNLIRARLTHQGTDRLHIQLVSGQMLALPRRLLSAPSADLLSHLMVRPDALVLGNHKQVKLKGIWRGAEFLGDSLMGHIDAEQQGFLIKLAVKETLPTEDSLIHFSFDLDDCSIL